MELFGIAKGKAARDRVVELLDAVALGPTVLDLQTNRLSGGERQRVAIARALAAEPDLLVCDEITSALDVSVQGSIVALLENLRKTRRISMLFVTHNLALVRSIAARVQVLNAGALVESGFVVEVLDTPKQDYTKRLLAQLARGGLMADPGLSSLHFVNPHRAPGTAAGWTYRPVPASESAPAAGRRDRWNSTWRSWGPAGPGAWPSSTSRPRPRRCWCWCTASWCTSGTGRGWGSADLFLGASATKSLLSHLVGVAVRAGALELTDRVAEHVPELAGSGYGRVPVGALVTMTSGVDWVEDHRDPVGPATALLSAFAGGTSSRAVLSRVGTRCPPGTRFEYCTADSQVLDWVRERATGVPFPEALQQLWADLGATADAAVAVDGDGVALAGGGVAAVACGLGPDRPAADPRHARRTGAHTCSTTTGSTRAPGRCSRSSPPAGCPARCPRTSGSATTGGRWTSSARGSAPTAAAASSSTSTGRARSSWSRPRTGPTPTRGTTGSAGT